MKDQKNEIRGFYYDHQLGNRSLQVTLHPNQIWDTSLKDGKGDWRDPTDSEIDNEEYETTTKKDEKGKKYPYTIDPICTSLIQEDFQISIVNNFTPFGNDAIGTLWNEFKPLAPYARDFAGNLGILEEKTADYVNKHPEKEGLFNDVLGTLAKVFGNLSNALGTGSKYLARSLVGQGTMFSYYSGTGIDFGQLQMKFTLFSQYLPVTVYSRNKDQKYEISNKIQFQTVDQQLKRILPYVIGEFRDFDLDSVALDFGAGDKVSKVARETANELLQWQMPPGNFEADFHNIDVVQKGTLKLRIGPYIALENVVIKTCQINYSKAMVKNPAAQMTAIQKGFPNIEEIVPHSCEVTLGIAPVTKYSRKSLEKFVFGNASKYWRMSTLEQIEGKFPHDQVEIDNSNVYGNITDSLETESNINELTDATKFIKTPSELQVFNSSTGTVKENKTEESGEEFDMMKYSTPVGMERWTNVDADWIIYERNRLEQLKKERLQKQREFENSILNDIGKTPPISF